MSILSDRKTRLYCKFKVIMAALYYYRDYFLSTADSSIIICCQLLMEV